MVVCHLCICGIPHCYFPSTALTGRNQRENSSSSRHGAARHHVCEAAAQLGSRRGRCHVQRLHVAASRRRETRRRHRQPALPVRRRHNAAKHGGRNSAGSGRRQRWRELLWFKSYSSAETTEMDHNTYLNIFCVLVFQILALFPFDDIQISGRSVVSVKFWAKS